MEHETTVSTATQADAAQLADLINSAYRAERQVEGWTNEVALLAGPRADQSSLQAILARPPSPAEPKATILLMRKVSDGRLVGCICVEAVEQDACYLSLLAIDPQVQNGGYGRLLLAEAERFAQGHGAHTAGMTVISQRETLIAWYERRGYRRTGEIIAFPYDDPSVGTPLRDDLQLVVLEKPLAPAAEPLAGA